MAEKQMPEEVGKSVAEIPLDIDAERYKAMELRLQEVIPEGAYDLFMKSDSDISEEYSDLKSEDPEAFDAVLRVNTDVNRQGMDRAQFSVDEAVEGSPIPEIDTYLMENSVYLNAVPPGFERERDLRPRATAQVVPESPIVERTRRGQLPGLAVDSGEQDSVRLHETVHSSGIMGDYDSLATKLFGDVETAEAATTGLDLYRAISRDDPIAARQSINYLISQGVNLFLHRDDLVDNMMRAIDVLEETSDGGIELTPERKVEIRSDIEKEFKNVPRILDNMRLERAGEKEPPKMNDGGLMGARELARQVDPETVERVFIYKDEKLPLDNPKLEEMNELLDSAFRGLFNAQRYGNQVSLSEGNDELRKAYSDRVREIRDVDPELFDEYFLARNTEEKSDALNREAFSDNPASFMQEEADEVPYVLNIPFGSEDEYTLGGPTGLRGWARHEDTFGNREILVAGKGGSDEGSKRSGVIRHETRHLKTKDAPMPMPYKNEELMRSFDALSAVLSQDMKKVEDIFDIEYGARFEKTPELKKQFRDWFSNDFMRRVQTAVAALPKMYETGVYDKEKVDTETLQKFLADYDADEQGFVSYLLGEEPERQEKVEKTINTSLDDATEIAKMISAAPFAEDVETIGFGNTARVKYDIDRASAEAEMNEGGLMADPLVLSETADEEAEPKMGIGEYIQAGAELVEDFSPAGTAEAIIETGKALTEGDYGKAAISALGAIPGGKTAGKAVNALEVGVDASKLAGDQLRKYASATVEMLEESAKKTGKVAGDKGEKLYAPVEEGTKVAVRKNLNSSVGEGIDPSLNTLQTLHKGTFSGKALSYMPVVTINNAEFAIGQAGRRDIAAKMLGKETKSSKNKFPMAAVNGEYTNKPSVLQQYNPEEVVEIGFNPKFNHLFIDMQTGQAVKGAEEATIIGDRVYARGVKYWKKSEAPEPLPTSAGEEIPSDVRFREMNAGGLMSDEYNRAES